MAGAKRKHQTDFGLTMNQQQQIDAHIVELGLSHKADHEKHQMYFAKLFGKSHEEIKLFIKQFKTRAANVDRENIDPGLLSITTPPCQPLRAAESATSDQLEVPTTASATNVSTSQPDSTQLQRMIGDLNQRVTAIEGRPAVKKIFLSKPTVAVRLVEKSSVYKQYKKWIGQHVREINDLKLAQDANYKRINLIDWEQRYQDGNGESFYHRVSRRGTEVDDKLWMQWEAEVEQLNNDSAVKELTPVKVSKDMNAVVRGVKKLLENLVDYGVQTQCYLFNVETQYSQNLSTGEFGLKVSKYLALRDVTHPPFVFAMEMFKASQKRSAGTEAITNSIEGMRQRVRDGLYKRLTLEYARLGFEQGPKTVQIKKLLRDEGFQNIKLIGFPYNAARYKSLTKSECQTVLDLLEQPNKIYLEIIDDTSRSNVENVRAEGGRTAEDHESEAAFVENDETMVEIDTSDEFIDEEAPPPAETEQTHGRLFGKLFELEDAAHSGWETPYEADDLAILARLATQQYERAQGQHSVLRTNSTSTEMVDAAGS